MRENRVESSEDLPEAAQVGHDFVMALILLRAPITLLKIKELSIKTMHDRPPQQVVRPQELHQALRYGVLVDREAETIRELLKIIAWLEENIS